MINRNNKKGFTIVELVIVIAVIAILAAVLIPTFAGIIRKANISADTQLAKNLNTALTAENVNNDIDDIYEVIDALSAQGFILANLNAKANECYYVWEKDTNQIILVDGKENYKVIFALNEEYGDIDESWYFVINDAELAKKVQAAYEDANVISFFETPSASSIEVPMGAIADLCKNSGNASVESHVASADLYIEIPTNGAEVAEIKIGESTYTKDDTFKLSIGNNKFITFSYFKVEDGKVSLAAPVVAFDTEAKYGVVGTTLVMNTGMENASALTEGKVSVWVNGTLTQLEKNAAGKYVMPVKNGAKNVMLTVEIPDVTTSDRYITKKTNGYGASAVDDLTPYGGNVGYWAYPLGYDKVVSSEKDGYEWTTNIYVVGKGYLTIEIVVDVVE